MKLRSLLALITQVQTANDISPIFITGGIARDKAIDKLNGTHLLKNISDIDLTTGDNSIHALAKNLGIELGKSFSVKTRELDDGHSSIMLGKLKIDCSSNYLVPSIDKILKVIGIQNPSDLDKEMWSRDFTCNALLLSLDLKTIKDPTHLGIKDIKNKVLRTCLDPNITLKSNLNRIPRVFYIAAKLGFSVEPSIIKWIAKNRNLISQIKPGYLAKTMEKAFHYDAEKTNQLIAQCGVGDILKLQPKTAQLVFKRNKDYGYADDSIDQKLPSEIAKKFDDLAKAQRGAPEAAMLKAQMYMGGGVLPVLLEHIGDLIHRMSEHADYGYTGYGPVREKVDKAISYLTNDYGFKREMEENFKNNATYNKIPLDEYMANMKKLLANYVQAHKALPTYNKAQKYANWAAMAIGNLQPNEALMWIYRLKDMLSSKEEWKKHAWEYDGKPFIDQAEDKKVEAAIRMELFKKSLPHVLAYFAGNENYGDEYIPGLDTQYYPGRTDDEHAIGENTLSEGNKDREHTIPNELKGFRKDRKKRLKRIKLRKILEDMGIDTSDIESDKVLLEGHPYSDDAFNQGVSGLFSYPLSYTGTIADNPNTIKDEYSTVYQRTD